MTGVDFWGQAKRVEEFARRDPDHRLVDLVQKYPEPTSTRVLDLGCAGGRNAVFLYQSGFDVEALDRSPAMLARTRSVLTDVAGPEEAARRVHAGSMDDIGFAEDGRYGMVVALGIYHLATGEAELARSLAETHRVLEPGGRVLVSLFGPGTKLRGHQPVPVENTPYVFSYGDGVEPGRDVAQARVCLLGPDALDTVMGEHGFTPETPTARIERLTETSHRIVTNGLYIRS